MRKLYLFIAILLCATTSAIGQENCLVDPCDPCGGTTASSFDFGGWVEIGAYANSHGTSGSGPHHADHDNHTGFNMHQLAFFGEKTMNTRCGFDWGARAELLYGLDGPNVQCFGDETFDFNWGTNRHHYGMGVNQLYGSLGYKELSVKVGKFETPIGYEATLAIDKFFHSSSVGGCIEPGTHMGVMADYNLTDRLTLTAGWITGEDCSFANPYHNKAGVAGFSYALTDDATVYYYINGGRQGSIDDEDDLILADYFMQSLVVEWNLTKRLTYVFQYNLRNDNERGGGTGSAYGINNHFFYKLNDRWSAGMRLEWLRDNDGYITEDESGDYYQATWGLKWDPYKNVSIRPEVRYDSTKGATPFAGGTKKDQFSGGCGVLLSF